MLKKRIGLDLDGVIIDASEIKIKLAKKFGYNISRQETSPELMKNILPIDITRAVQNSLYNKSPFSLLLPTVKGAKEAIEKLYSARADYFLISRRKAPDIASALLEKHGLWPKYFNGQNSFFVSEIEDKNKKAKELGINYFVDDEIKVLKKLNSVENKFLFDQYDALSEIRDYERFNSWKELLKKLL